MRPIKLTVSAFCSYAGKNVIEFDKLGTDGLYLITGVTGAGKSTIFEAITFALYGEVSDKAPQILRSEYADPSVETFVELEFEYIEGGKSRRYTIKRNPEYMRQSKRGGGVTKQQARATLICPDGEVVENIKSVTPRITEILGMTREQFKQTVMIEQGRFRELLTADTKTRKNILRSIFNIGVYHEFQERIGERASKVKNDLDKSLGELAGVCEDIKCDENEELSALKNRAASGELLILPELEAALKDRNSEDKALLEELEKKQKTIGEKMLKINELITKGNEQIKLRSELDAALESLPQVEKQSAEKSTEAERCEQEKSAENEKLNKDIGALENELPKYKALKEKRQDLAELEKRAAENSKVKDSLEKRLKALREDLDNLREESAALENAGENIVKLNAELEKCERRSKALLALKGELRELEKSRKEFDDSREKYLKADKLWNELKAAADDKRRRFNDEQAGILAETLREFEPCPVCGSLEHPCPAQKTAGAPSKEEVEEAEANAEEARGNSNYFSSECGAKKSVIEEKERGILSTLSELLPSAALENANESADRELEIIKKKSAELNEELTAETRKSNRKRELAELLPQKQGELEETNKVVGELDSAIASDAGSAKLLREQIEGEERGLKFQSEADVNARIEALCRRIDENGAAIKAAKKAAEEWAQKLQKITAEMETHKKLLSAEEPIDVEEKSREMEQLRGEDQLARTRSRDIFNRYNANEVAAKKLSQVSARAIAAERENTLVKSLADTARGQLSGTVKIDLEAFVQARYLDSILHCANKHLLKMSNGQYELKRRETVETTQGQHSLDLNVKDYYNGTSRDVKSLSGGEAFLASLSLALGLSDTVQQRSGGVRLETMFIDEGFGTLSSEFLDRAMSVLRSLTEANRLIGMISHVEELKRLIPKRIEITKDGAKGSRAAVVV